MSALESALTVIRACAADGSTAGLRAEECAALTQHIDRLTAALAEARRQVQAACCGPWHERESAEADAATFPWQRVKAAREVAGRWHAHAYRESVKGPHSSTVAWAVAQTVLSLVLAELDYDGIAPRDEQETDPAVLVPARRDTAAETPAPRPFRVGDIVEITAREDEDEATPPGLRLNGRTAPVCEIDEGGTRYPIGLDVEGWVGPVWCSPAEIRHAAPGSEAQR